LTVRTFMLGASLALAATAAAEIPLAERRSGYEFMGRETRAMQDDEATNPAVLWLLDGEALWKKKEGAADKACVDCHGDARESMRGAAARHPAWDAGRGRVLNLEQRINACRVDRQKAPALPHEGRELLGLTVYLARQSRGLPVQPEANDKATTSRVMGRTLFFRRQGQLNLSCAQCHDDKWGRSLAGVAIPQAHPTGYPLYRLEWQGVGSLQRRIRNCMTGIRAETYAFGAQEHVDLELYLMWRARGMKMEAPAVRP